MRFLDVRFGFPQAPKTRHIGIILGGDEGGAKYALESILAGLREYGYVPGQNISVHTRYSAGQPSLMAAQADEMIALKVDVVLTFDTAAAILRQKTTTLPIVLLSSVDPVAAGLVQSFARPGTNVTGMSAMWEQVLPKYFQLLLETNPKITRISMLYDDSITPQVQDMHLRMAGGIAFVATREWWDVGPWGKAVREASARFGLEAIYIERSAGGFEEVFAAARRVKPDAIYYESSPEAFGQRTAIGAFALESRIPSACGHAPVVEAGCLMTYNFTGAELMQVEVDFIDRIAKGAKAGELPYHQYSRYELVVNAKTARAIGLTIPQSVLVRADRVIE